MVLIPEYNFNQTPGSDDSDAEDINMDKPSMLPVSQPSLITRTYSRKPSIVEKIIQEWETDLVGSSSNAIQSCSTDPFAEETISPSGSPSDEVNVILHPGAEPGMVFFFSFSDNVL